MKMPYVNEFVLNLFENSMDSPQKITEAEAEEWINEFKAEPTPDFSENAKKITAQQFASDWNALCDWQEAETAEYEANKPWWM